MLGQGKDMGTGTERKTSKATEIELGVKLRGAFIASDKYLPLVPRPYMKSKRQ